MPERATDEHLLRALTEVFRAHGYEGATLARVSDATGLKKSSLYHRFPAGKEQMAAAVLDAAAEHVAAHVLAPLRGTGSPRRRIKEAARRIAEFYGDGQKACLLDTLSFAGAPDHALEKRLRAAHDFWIESFASVAREAGLPPRTAQARAIEALVKLEGALVVARVAAAPEVFQRVLASLPDLLSKP